MNSMVLKYITFIIVYNEYNMLIFLHCLKLYYLNCQQFFTVTVKRIDGNTQLCGWYAVNTSCIH